MNQNTFPKLARGLRLFYCAALMSVLAVSQVPLRTAQASNIFERIQIKEKTAVAEWQYQEGNVITFVSVVVAESAALPGSTAATPAAAVSVFRQTLTGVPIFIGSGVTDTFQFSADTNLSTAHVAATLDVSDTVSATVVPFTVDLTWTGTGDLTQEHSRSHFQEEGFIVITNFQGAHRPADAAGTVSGGGINYTPIPTSLAQIQRNDNGGVTVLTGHDAGP